MNRTLSIIPPLSIPASAVGLTNFSLEPAAIVLPQQEPQYTRTHSLAGHQTSSASSGYYPSPPVPTQTFYVPTTSSGYIPPALPPQHVPSYVPVQGSASYQFVPIHEYDEKGDLAYYQHIGVRPEMSHKSPEEYRLEDYGCAQPPILQPQQQQATIAPFGTTSVGLFSSVPQTNMFGTNSNSAFAPATNTTTAFGAPAFGQPAFQPQQQPAFGTSFTNTNPWQQPPAQQPLFGTVSNNLFAPQQPQQQQQSAFSNAFTQPTFQTTAFQQPTFQAQQPLFPQQPTFQPQQQSNFFMPQPQFQAPAPATTNTFFTSFQNPLGGGNFLAPATAFSYQQSRFGQNPTQAHFFWMDHPITNWMTFLQTLPPRITTVSFAGVTVEVPSQEYCAAAREREKSRIAKLDADPYGLSRLAENNAKISSPTPSVQQLVSGSSEGSNTTEASANNTNSVANSPASSVPSSPLKRGTSSPLLIPSTRSPILTSRHHRIESNSGSSSLLTSPAHHTRSSLSASFTHSPRLVPLPPSPYLSQSGEYHVVGSSSSPKLHARSSHSQSGLSTPTKSYPTDRGFHHHGHSAGGSGSGTMRTILFGTASEPQHRSSQQQQQQQQQCKNGAVTSPEITQHERELAWSNRLVE